MSTKRMAARRSSESCPVEALAREAERVTKLIEQFDVSDRENLLVQHAQKLLWRQLNVIEERASHLHATSLAGALFQVRLAQSTAVRQFECDGFTEEERVKAYELIARYLDSASRILRWQVGKDVLWMDRRFYGGPDRRPDAVARFTLRLCERARARKIKSAA